MAPVAISDYDKNFADSIGASWNPMFICVIVILFYLIYKMKRVTKPNDERVISLQSNFYRLYLFPTP